MCKYDAIKLIAGDDGHKCTPSLSASSLYLIYIYRTRSAAEMASDKKSALSEP